MKLRTIYDLGANHGEDTARYLHYADKVISVEANPIIAEGLSHKFAAEIAAGRVELLNIGIWNTRGKLPFYRHNNDHWSSFDPNYGMREGGYEIIDIETVTFPDLVRAHGQPDFLKIDIEGGEWEILADTRFGELSVPVISMEYHGLHCPGPDPRSHALALLHDAGYRVEPFLERQPGIAEIWASRS